jgi:hypothetical protein
MPVAPRGDELSGARRRLALMSVAVIPLMFLHEAAWLPKAGWNTLFIFWAAGFLFFVWQFGREKAQRP